MLFSFNSANVRVILIIALMELGNMDWISGRLSFEVLSSSDTEGLVCGIYIRHNSTPENSVLYLKYLGNKLASGTCSDDIQCLIYTEKRDDDDDYKYDDLLFTLF